MNPFHSIFGFGKKNKKNKKSLLKKQHRIVRPLCELLEDRITPVTGDIAILTASNAIAIDNGGDSINHNFNNIEINTGSAYTFSPGSTDITINDSGHHLVLYNSRFDSTGGGNRSEFQTQLNLSGVGDLPIGWSQGYIRRGSGADEAITAGGGIIDVTAGQVLQLQTQRTDDNGADAQREPDGTAIQLVKLDDSWDYLRLSDGSVSGMVTGGFEDVSYSFTDENDGGAFGFSGGSDITLNESGHYLVFANTFIDKMGGGRTTFLQQLTLDGNGVPGTTTSVYQRGDNSTNEGAASFGGIIEASMGQVLSVQVAKANGSDGEVIGAKTAITIVKLPDEGDFIRLSNSNVSDINPGGQTSSGTPLDFDTELEVDTDSFSHSGSQVTATQGGDFLFFNSYYHEDPGGLRTVANHGYQVNGGGIRTAGQTARYNRDADNGGPGDGNDIAANWGGAALVLNQGDTVEVVARALGNGSTAPGEISLQGVRIQSLFPPPTVENLRGDTLVYPNGGPAQIIDQGGDTLVTDNQTDFNGGSLTISFTGGSGEGSDILSIDDGGALGGNPAITLNGATIEHNSNPIGTFTGGGGSALMIDFTTADATPAAVSALLQSILYEDLGDAALNSIKSVEFELFDGSVAAPTTLSATITIARLVGSEDSHTWDGDSDGDGNGIDWDDPLNWSNDVVPDGNDIAIFDGLDQGAVDLQGLTHFVGVLQISGNYTLENGTLQIIDSSATTGRITHDAGTTTIAAAIDSTTLVTTITGGTLAISNTGNSISNLGSFNVEPGGTLRATADPVGSAMSNAEVNLNDGTLEVVANPPDQPPVTNDLHLWLDASKTANIQATDGNLDTSGESIFAWNDILVGDNIFAQNAIQFDLNKRPAWVDNAVNGFPAIQFTSNKSATFDDDLQVNDLALDDQVTMFFVIQHATQTAEAGVGSSYRPFFVSELGLEFGGSDDNNHYALSLRASDNDPDTFRVEHPSGQTDNPGVVTPIDDSFHVYTFRRNGNANNGTEAFIDGSSFFQDTATDPANTALSYFIGGQNNHPERHYNGLIPEILIYDEALSASDQQAVENYLNTKYIPGGGGITSTVNNNVTVSGDSTIIAGATVNEISFANLTMNASSTLNVDGGDVSFSSGSFGGNTVTFNAMNSSQITLGPTNETAPTSVTKEGTGTLVLTDQNTYSGETVIDEGSVIVTADGALGTTAGGTIVNDGGALVLSGNLAYSTPEDLTIEGSGNANHPAALLGIGPDVDISYAGPITVTTNATIAADSAIDDFTLTGGIDLQNNSELTFDTGNDILVDTIGITGSGSIVKTNPDDQLKLLVDSDYTGLTTVVDGRLEARASTALGATGAGNETIVEDGASVAFRDTADGPGVAVTEDFIITGNGETVNGVGMGALWNRRDDNTINGSVTLVGDARIRVNEDDTAGNPGSLTINGPLIGAPNLEKTGDRPLILQANSPNFTGDFTINNGMVIIEDAGALGTAAGGTFVGIGGSLGLQGDITLSGEAVQIDGPGATGEGALLNISGDNTYITPGPIPLGGELASVGSLQDNLTITTPAGLPTDLIFDLGILGTLSVGGSGNVDITGQITSGTPVTDFADLVNSLNPDHYYKLDEANFADPVTDSAGTEDGVYEGPEIYNVQDNHSGVVSPVINYGGGGGDFGNNIGYGTIGSGLGGSDFSVRAQAFLRFNTGGSYTIRAGSDDGRLIELTPHQLVGGSPFAGFTSVGDQNSGFLDPNTVFFNGTTGHDRTEGVFEVAAGDVLRVDSFFFERGGGDSFELSIRQGTSGGFELLQDGSLGGVVDVSTNDAFSDSNFDVLAFNIGGGGGATDTQLNNTLETLAIWDFIDANPGFTTGATGAIPDVSGDFGLTDTAPNVSGTYVQFGFVEAVDTADGLVSNLDAFTISGWVRLDTTTPDGMDLFGQNDAIEFFFNDDDELRLFTEETGNLDVDMDNTPIDLRDGNWHLVSAVGTGTQKQIYFDGVLVGTQNHGPLPGNGYGDSGSDFSIGADVRDGGGNNLNGDLDEIVVWERALSGATLTKLAQQAPAQPSVDKTGTGTLTLAGDNNYRGPTTINEGVVVATNANSLGLSTTPDDGTNVSNQATLVLQDGPGFSLSEDLTIAGTGATGQNGALVNASGNNSISSDIQINPSASQVGISSEQDTLTIDGNIDLQDAKIILDGSGNTIVNGDIFGNGDPLVVTNTLLAERYETGTLQIDFNNQGSPSGAFNIEVDGTFSQSSGLLSGSPDFSGSQDFGPLNYARDGSTSQAGPDPFTWQALFPTVPGGDQDQFQVVWMGLFTPDVDGIYTFRSHDIDFTGGNVDDDASIYIDANLNSIFEGSEGFESGSGSAISANLSGGTSYPVIFGFNENGGNEQISYTVEGPSGSASETGIDPSTQNGMFSIRMGSDNRLMKMGTGTVTLTGDNSFNGETAVMAGTLVAASDTALGTTDEGTTVADGATLAFDNTLLVNDPNFNNAVDIPTAETLTITGNGSSGVSHFNNIAGNNKINADITIEEDTEFPIEPVVLTISSQQDLLTLDGSTLTIDKLILDGPGDIEVNSQITPLQPVTPGGSFFNEIGGVVSGEGEEFTSRTDVVPEGDSWLIVDDEDQGADTLNDARGDGKYIQALPDQAGGGGGPMVAPSAEFEMQITQTGIYQLYLRWANNNNVGSGGNSDSIFVDIVEIKDGVGSGQADWYELTKNSDTFTWDAGGQAEVNQADAADNDMTWNITTPGTYTLRISQREDGAAVDAWAFQLASLPALSGNEFGPPSTLTTLPPPVIEGEVMKMGSGTTTLTNSLNDYDGPTTIMEGTLEVTGAIGPGPVTILDDGTNDYIDPPTLTGSGIVGGPISAEQFTLINPGDGATLGDGSDDGFSTAGKLEMAPGTTATINDSNVVELGEFTVINSSATVDVIGGATTATIAPGGNLSGSGTLNASVSAGIYQVGDEWNRATDWGAGGEQNSQTDFAGNPVWSYHSVDSGLGQAIVQYALIDVGAIGQRVEPGALDFSLAANGNNGTEGFIDFISETGDSFRMSVDDTTQAGTDDGAIDWRDRGDSNNDPLVAIGEDHIKNNSGTIRITLESLPAGTFNVTTWHLDSQFDNVTDGADIFVDTGSGFVQVVDDGLTDNDNSTSGNNVTTADVLNSQLQFSFTSDGVNDVIIIFDGDALGGGSQLQLNGLLLEQDLPNNPFWYQGQLTDLTYDAGDDEWEGSNPDALLINETSLQQDDAPENFSEAPVVLWTNPLDNSIEIDIDGSFDITWEGDSPTYAEEVLADSPIVYYQFEETSGTTAADTSGSGTVPNDGTFTNGANPNVTGPVGLGSAVSFDGNDDFVDANVNLNSVIGTDTGAQSVEFWINTTQASTSGNIWDSPGVAGVEHAGGADDIFWGVLDNTGRIEIAVGNGTRFKSTNPINDGQWHHVAMTHNGTGFVEIYVDGTLNASGQSGDNSGVTAKNFFGIGMVDDRNGANVQQTPRFLDGDLDEFAIFNGVLSETRVQAHFAAGIGGGGANTRDVDFALAVFDSSAGTWSTLPSGTGTGSHPGGNNPATETITISETGISLDAGDQIAISHRGQGSSATGHSQSLADNITLTLASIIGESGANLFPGDDNGVDMTGDGTVGTLNINSLALSDTSSVDIDLDGPTAGEGSGFHDQVNASGTVDLNEANLDLSLTYEPIAGEELVIINNDGNDGINGTFAGLPEGAPIKLNDFNLVQYALIDVGADGQRLEPGALDFSLAANNNNGTEGSENFISDTGDSFTMSVDDTTQAGTDDGRIDWRDRGNSNNDLLVAIGEDHIKNNSGTIRITLSSLPAGTFNVTSWHLDSQFDNVTDGADVFVDTGSGFVQVIDDGLTDNDNSTSGNNVTTADVLNSQFQFSFTSDGVNDVIIVFDGDALGGGSQLQLNGLLLEQLVPSENFLFEITYEGGTNNNDVALISAGPAETDVDVVGGDLVITDIANVTDDELTISIDGSDYVITDPNVVVSSNFPNAVQQDIHTVRVPIADVTGGLIVDTLAGADSFTIDSALNFNGDATLNAETNILNDDLSTSGNQDYNGVVVLGADVNLTGVDVNFTSTVDSDSGNNWSLTVDSTGTSLFDGAVGGSDALNNLTVGNGSGTTEINGGIVSTTGNQSYNDNVFLGDDTTLNGMDVIFSGTVNSDSGNNWSLDVNASGTTRFGGMVGNADALSTLTTDAGGTTEINGGSVDTTSAQTYNDSVILGANTTLTGSTVNFFDDANGTGPGSEWLQIFGDLVQGNGPGDYIGNAVPLNFLNVTGATTFNSSPVAADNVTTVNNQDYQGPVTLSQNTTVTSQSGDVAFSSTVDSDGTPWSLTVNSPGTTTFAMDVGTASALDSLTTDDPGTTILGGDVTTVGGTQTFGDDVVLTSDVILTDSGSTGIEFGGTVTDNGNGFQMTVDVPNPGAEVDFQGDVLGTLNLVKEGDGTLIFQGADNSFTGSVDVNGGNVNLPGNLTGVDAAPVNINADDITINGFGSGQIQDRPVLVPTDNVAIQNLQQMTDTDGTALFVTGGVSLQNVTVEGSQVGVHLQDGSLNLISGNEIATAGAGTVGLLLDGNGSELSGGGDVNSFGDTAFEAPGLGAGNGLFIQLNNTAFFENGEPVLLLATNSTFNGLLGSNLTSSDLSAVGQQIIDFNDISTVGLVLFQFNSVTVENGQMNIIGSLRSDRITVNTTNPGSVTVRIGASLVVNEDTGDPSFDLTGFGEPLVKVLGLDSDDKITISGDVSAEVFGGLGDDQIRTQDGNDVLIGGAGRDNLNSGGGDDIVVGGLDRDRIETVDGDDLIFAGSTSLTVEQLKMIGTIPLQDILDSITDPDFPERQRNQSDRIDSGRGNDTIFLRLTTQNSPADRHRSRGGDQEFDTHV